MHVGCQGFLFNFKTSCSQLVVEITTNKYCIHDRGQLSDYLIKITKELSILQR